MTLKSLQALWLMGHASADSADTLDPMEPVENLGNYFFSNNVNDTNPLWTARDDILTATWGGLHTPWLPNGSYMALPKAIAGVHKDDHTV